MPLSLPTAPHLDSEPDRAFDGGARQRLAQLLVALEPIEGFYAKLDRIQRTAVDEPAGYLGAIDFTADYLVDVEQLHGGGKYRARIHNARGRYQTSFTFSLEGNAKPRPAIAQENPRPRSIASRTSRLGFIRARAQDHQDEIESVRWFTPQRLAARWDLSLSTIYIIPREALPYKEFGAGTELKRRRYHPDDVAAYEARDRAPTGSTTSSSADVPDPAA